MLYRHYLIPLYSIYYPHNSVSSKGQGPGSPCSAEVLAPTTAPGTQEGLSKYSSGSGRMNEYPSLPSLKVVLRVFRWSSRILPRSEKPLMKLKYR